MNPKSEPGLISEARPRKRNPTNATSAAPALLFSTLRPVVIVLGSELRSVQVHDLDPTIAVCRRAASAPSIGSARPRRSCARADIQVEIARAHKDCYRLSRRATDRCCDHRLRRRTSFGSGAHSPPHLKSLVVPVRHAVEEALDDRYRNSVQLGPIEARGRCPRRVPERPCWRHVGAVRPSFATQPGRDLRLRNRREPPCGGRQANTVRKTEL